MSSSSEHEFEGCPESYLERYSGDVTCVSWKIDLTSTCNYTEMGKQQWKQYTWTCV